MTATKPKTLQELREEREGIKTQIAEIRKQYDARKAEGKKGDECWGGKDERQKFLGLDDRRKQLDAEIKDIEDEQRFVEVEEERRNDPTPPQYVNGINHDREAFEQRAVDRRLMLRAWSAHGVRGFEIDKRTREACQRHGFDPSSGQVAAQLSDTHEYQEMRSALLAGRLQQHLEKRALSALQPTAGGALVGSMLMQQLEVNMLHFGTIERISEVILTDTGEDIAWPTADDTSNEGTLLGENQQISSSTDPSFKKFRLGAYDFSSDIIKVPRNLLVDPGYDVGTEITRMQGERIARKFNRKCTVGLGGANEPYGYITSGTLGKTTASATAVTRKEIVDLIHSVDVAYRDPERCRLVMHDLILSEVRKLEDSQNRPLDLITYDPQGRPRFREGNILVEVNNHQDSTLTASQKTMAFGDFRYGKVRRVRGVVVQRLVERFADYNQVGFLAIVRQDYNVLNAGTAPIKYLQQHA